MADADSLHSITVHIAPGTYSKTKTNEEFPLFVPSFVSVVGDNMENTILDGEGERSLIRLSAANDVIVKNMTLQNGFARAAGGIYCESGRSISFDQLLIKNNIAAKLGGAGVKIWDDIFNDLPDENIVFNNVLIVGNKSLKKTSRSYSGGLDIGNVDVKLLNTTIAHNISESASGYKYAGGLAIWEGADVKIVNSIIAFNEPHNMRVIGDTKVRFAYSTIEGGVDTIVEGSDSTIIWLTGNIYTDPIFLGGEPFDYRLSKFSSCIDAGTAFLKWEGDTLLNLSPDQYLGSAPDMGAVEFDPSTGIESSKKKPMEFNLDQNYPNPFNPITTIQYFLPKSCPVHLAVYDNLGREVAVLVDEYRQAGTYKIIWDGKNSRGLNLASGVYFYKLKGGDYEEVKKLLLVR